MSAELRTGLEQLAREVERRHAGDPGLSLPLIERAAHTRRRRHDAVLSGTSVAVVAVLALTASVLLRDPAPTPPVSTPVLTTPAPTPTPTPPSPQPSPVVEPPAPALAIKDDPAEPDALPMTEAVWDQVGPGWALAVFSTLVTLPDDAYGHLDPAGTQALFLVAPDRTTYRVTSVPADGYGQVMWFDPVLRKAWMYFKGMGESYSTVGVDLRDGSLVYDLDDPSAPGERYRVPVVRSADGRVLWAQADPLFPTGVTSLFWLEADGSFTSVPGATDIQGDVWLAPEGDRVVYLTNAGELDAPALTLVRLRLADEVAETTPLGGVPGTYGCTLQDVGDQSVAIFCTVSDPLSSQTWEVTDQGDWASVPSRQSSNRMVQEAVLCGYPDVPWSSPGRILPAPLAAQGWIDALVLPAAGESLSGPKASICE